MKKIILTTFLVLISIPSYSYATGACLIKDKSAQVLLDYIKDNRKVVENISKSIIKNKTDKTDESKMSFNKILETTKETFSYNELERGFNEVFSFDGYYSYAKFFAIFPVSNEIPYEVKRDYRIIEDENKGMAGYYKKIISSGVSNVNIEKPCSGISLYCNYKEGTANEILTKLIKNNENILDLYRLTVMGEEQDLKGEKLMLVNKNFESEIKKYYSRESVNMCNRGEGGFFTQIKDAIKNIKLLTKEGDEGIQKWKDAWALLIGNNPGEEARIEREQLRENMQSEGIRMDYQEIIQGNLKDFNLEGISLNNNFITNTFDLIKSNVWKELKAFKEEAFYNPKETENRNDLSIDEIKRLERTANKTIDHQERITLLYQKELPFAAIGSISTENLRSRIIDAHASLDRSIQTLEKIIPKSQDICKKQGGGGKCD